MRSGSSSHPPLRGVRRRSGRFAAAAAALSGLALAACGALPPLPERDVLDASDIGLASLTQPPNPPEIIARSGAEIGAASARASPERLALLAGHERAKKRSGPELALFFEAPIGRAYLEAGLGRALARAEPAETCPGFGAALARPSARDAAKTALTRCFDSLPAGAEGRCGCRLIAAGEVLLAPPEAFEYARAVSAFLIGRGAGAPVEALLVADGPDPSGLGEAEVRRLTLRAATGPVGRVEIAADGAAELDLGGAIYRGWWAPEGRRRGRIAGVAGLRGEDGRRVALFIGYEPAEIEARRAELASRARVAAR